MPFNDNLPAENTNPWYAPITTAWANLKTFVNSLETALGLKADTSDLGSAAFTSASSFVPVTRTVAGKTLSADVTLAKADVGLGDVDNTSDANKPVSSFQQTALDGKVPTSRTVAGYALTADVPRAGLNTRGVGEALFIPTGATVPGDTPVYTIIIEAV